MAGPMKWLMIASALLLCPALAHADPCEGRLPDRAGETFSGVVRYVGDGDSCVWVPAPIRQPGSRSGSRTSMRQNCTVRRAVPLASVCQVSPEVAF